MAIDYQKKKISFTEISVPTGGIVLNFWEKGLKRITFINDDDANFLTVNPCGDNTVNISKTNAVKNDGSDIITSAGAAFVANGIKSGDLVHIHKGDADDGIYEIIEVLSATAIRICQAMTADATSVPIDIKRWKIKAGEYKSYDTYATAIKIKADTGAISTRIEVQYQLEK